MAEMVQVKLSISAIDKATAPLRNVAKALGGVAKSFTFGIGAGAGIAAFQSISRLADELLSLPSKIIATSAQFENFLAVLETTEGSSEKARKALDWVQDFATRTPYDVAEVTDAFVKLRAYGLEPTAGLLQTLGDTASAMGKPIVQAVEAVADAVTGEYERLKEFGIKASKNKGDVSFTYTDKEGKQQVKTIKDNNKAIIQSTLQTIWNNKYQGAMDKRSKTWGGMLSNLADTWTKFQMKIANAGFFDAIKARLKGFLDLVDQMAANGSLDAIAKSIGETMTMGVDKATAAVVALWGTLRQWADPTNQAKGAADVLSMAGGKLVVTLSGVVDVLSSMLGMMRDVAGAAKSLAEALGPLLKLGTAVNSVNAKIWSAWDAVGRGASALMGGGEQTPAPSAAAKSAAAIDARNSVTVGKAAASAAAAKTTVGGSVDINLWAQKGTEAILRGVKSRNPAVPLTTKNGFSMSGF